MTAKDSAVIAGPPAKRASKARRTTVPGLDRISAGGRGRGAVDAILAAPSLHLVDLALDLLDPHPDNLREEISDLDETAAEMRQVGVLEPLLVASADAFWAVREVTDTIDSGRYVILAGHRRAAAARKAGLTVVPCIVRDDLAGRRDTVVTMLIENLHREGLKAVEEARGYRLLEDLDMTQGQIAELVGCSQANVSKKLALLKLPPEVQLGVNDGEIPIAEAVELARYSDDPEIVRIAQTRPTWQSIDQVANDVKERRGREAAIAAREAELRAADPDVRIVAWPNAGWPTWVAQNASAASFRALVNDGVAVADHAALPCHAISVGFASGDKALSDVDVCTTPGVHIKARKAGERDKQAKADAARTRKKAREEEKVQQQATVRRDLLGKQLGGRSVAAPTEAAAYQVLVAMLVDFLDGDEALAIAARAVGCELPDSDDMWELSRAGGKELLDKAQTPAGMKRVVAALALGYAEDRTTGMYASDRSISSPYLRWLQTLGHTLAGVERQLVQESKS
jgi:ParB family chromosome partitioning protein